MKRIFLIVLDSVGIGEMPDAAKYHDEGSNTLMAVFENQNFAMPNMAGLGLFSIDGIDYGPKTECPKASFARLSELSAGKDTTIGHWEIAGIVSKKPLPVYPNGFPEDVIKEFERRTGQKVICNMPYSGTEVIKDYGEEHMRTGALIVYTSADSVFQVAAHEEVVSVEQLYEYCKTAREMLTGEHGVGRVIARPFTGRAPNFVRTANRHDFSLEPPGVTMLDQLKEAGLDVLSIGKIVDIFASRGITDFVRTKGNTDGLNRLLDWMDREFEGLCFVNLVDFDMLYGHRNDADGYAAGLSEFDAFLPKLLLRLKEEDILMITADHGCDPSTPSTDHSREYVPWVIAGSGIKEGCNLGTLNGFSHIAATIQDYFEIPNRTMGTSVLDKIQK